MPLSPGTLFAGYRIESLLGRGGMGEVYRATHADLGRAVALKLMPESLGADPSSRARFLAESRLAASLDHPHIVPIYEAGEIDGQPFIAMRFVDGRDLGAILAGDGPLEPIRAVRLLTGIADALDAAHERGLVHRDVKPENILVVGSSRGEHAYLADFGLGKQIGSGGQTVAGQLFGSIDYMAPEQIDGSPAGGSADIYSLGCVLYACVVGRPPFPNDTAVATLWAHLHTEPPAPSRIRPEAAPLDEVLAQAMAKAPNARFATAADLMRAAAGAVGITDMPRDPSPGPSLVAPGDEPRPGPDAPGTTALPAVPSPIGSLIGRSRELLELGALLADRRLVTIVGPGGVGKTRVALAVAAAAASSFEAVAFVDLSPVREPDGILPAMVEALQLDQASERKPEQTIADAVAGRSALLIIDNVEQVADGAPHIAALLSAAPGLHVLATSRVRLAVRGEREFPLGPLPLPDDQAPFEDIAASDAVRMFMEEVQRHGSASLSASNAGSVAEICRRLDGLPLALEVVAARTRTLAMSELLGQLGDRIDLPAADSDVPVRQRTLRAAIAWSVDLLRPTTRALFRRLGVFVGGFDGPAAAEVGGDAHASEAIEELARHSLLVRRGESRFAMLETIREFALDELGSVGDEEATRDRLIDWLATRLEKVEDAFIRGLGQGEALALAEPDRANVRDAIRWAAANGREARALLLASAKNYWGFRGLGSEIRVWLEDLLARPVAYDDLTRAHALTTLGSIDLRAGEFDPAREIFASAQQLWEQLGDRRKVAVIDNNLSIIAERSDDFALSRMHAERALVVMRDLDDRVAIAAIVGNLGVLADRMGDVDSAQGWFETSVELARELGDDETLTIGLNNLALIAVRRRDAERAGDLLQQALELAVHLEDSEGITSCIELAAQLAALASRDADVVRLIAGAERSREDSGFARPPAEVVEFGDLGEAARKRLGEPAYREATGQGRALSLAALIDLAKEQIEPPTGAASD